MKKAKLDYVFVCGRAFLMADGFAIVMEGDPLRDPDLAKIGEKFSVRNTQIFQATRGLQTKQYSKAIILIVAGCLFGQKTSLNTLYVAKIK